MRRKVGLTLAFSVHGTAANVAALSCHKSELSHLSCNSFILLHNNNAASSLASFPYESSASQCNNCAMREVITCNSTSPILMSGRNYCMHTLLLRQSWSKLNTRPWMCVKEECRAVNRFTASLCESCGAAKPTLRGWKCVKCDTVNYSGVKKCKKCGVNASESNEFWMCAMCKENNRIDEIEDNSRCGYCGYDMAPHRTAEEEILRRAQERQEELQNKQEEFDSITVKEAEDQWGDSLADADRLPKEVREPSKKRIKLPVESMKPFKPAPIPTSAHSRISRQIPSVASAEVNDGPPGFDWMCRVTSCRQINPGDEEDCMTCKAHFTRSEWECQECGAINHASRPRCFACQTTIPVSWNCASCKTETSIYEKQCCDCGAARPTVEPRIPHEIKSRANDMSNSRRSHERRSDWNCESCDALNFAFRDSCFQCGSARSPQKSSMSSNRDGGFDSSSRHRSGWSSRSDDGWGSGKSSGRAGGYGSKHGSSGSNNNWICAHCESSNFRTRTTCWQCGRDSPSSHDTSHSSSKSPVHFDKEGFQDNDDVKPAEGMMNSWNKKEDGWICARCYCTNHANRVDCHKCGTAKVVAVAPRRASARKPVKL